MKEKKVKKGDYFRKKKGNLPQKEQFYRENLFILEAMANESEKTKIPSQIIFENLKELLRAKNTAHESMFKFHWKKMWPFSLIWPQVDYERIVRLMSEIRKNAIIQKNLVLQAKNVAKEFEKEFLEALDISCQKLSAAAQWKQDMLLKRIHKDVKFRRDVSEYNRILKEYEEAQGNLVRAGAFVQVGWGKVVQAMSNV